MDQICSRRTSRLLVALLLTAMVTGVSWAQAPTPPSATPSPSVSPTPAASTPASPTAETPEPPDTIVLKVGDQQFTKADMDSLIGILPPQVQQAIAARGRKDFVDRYALMVMLSQQAHVHHLDQTPDLIRKVAFQKLQLEAQAEMEHQAKVTPEDLQQYYTMHAADYDGIMARQFVIYKKAAEPKADAAHPTAPIGPGLAPEEAKARAEAIRKELTAGADIKKIMEEFKASSDVRIDSEPRTFRRGGLPPDMEKVAFALKDGEVSEPIDMPQRLVLIQVTGHSRLDLKDVSAEIERALQQQKVNAALDAVKRNTTLWMDEQYFAGPSGPPDRPTMGAPAVKMPPKP